MLYNDASLYKSRVSKAISLIVQIWPAGPFLFLGIKKKNYKGPKFRNDEELTASDEGHFVKKTVIYFYNAEVCIHLLSTSTFKL